MRLWFAPNSEIPIYRQLATQVTLAILSGELKPGDRLPSTRELARRFDLHPNTISSGYKQLEREGWTERRQGSGVYVRPLTHAHGSPEQIPIRMLDQHIAGFFKMVRELKLPEDLVRARVAHWLTAPRADHFLLIDPDPLLRQILLTELSAFTVSGADMSECSTEILATAVPLCRPSKTAQVRALLPAGTELITLPIRSANTWLRPWLPVADGALIAIVSHWPDFLEIARTMLIAAGLNADALIFRDAGKPGWRKGLETTAAILCDAHTATLPFPKGPAKIIFPLIAGEAHTELATIFAH